MAYAALTSLLQTMKQIRQPKQLIASLREKVSRLLVILEDSSRNPHLTIDHLESQIRDASYQVEYIIESHVSSQALSWRVSRCFWEMISAFHLSERWVEYMNLHMDMDIEGLQKRIDEFDSMLETLSRMNSSALATSSRLFASSKSTIVGRDEDMLLIKDRLTRYPPNLDVISIVGTGGIGKTTLARNVCDDFLSQYRFDICAWVVISSEYHLQKVLTGLLDSITHPSGRLHQVIIGGLQEYLYASSKAGRYIKGSHRSCQLSIKDLEVYIYKILKGRRYLIVMDDVWDTKVWNDVKRLFPDDNNGSRVILTTRNSEIAIYADSYIHKMNHLDGDQSWYLLCEKVFGKECCPFALEQIGKKIAGYCNGLPLAIVLIGGILSKGIRTQDYWEYIGNDFQFMNILSLSYNSLPYHLKPCFLYMGGFPEDHEILVSQLIKIWIAEGFVKPQTSKSLEEVAKDYLKDLADRNLIMVQKRNHMGGIKVCMIHDLLRELCLRLARDEKFIQIINSDIQVFPEGENNQLRLSIHSDSLVHLANVHDSSVRALLYFCSCFSNSELLSIIMSYRLLRVLDALTIRFNKFPIEIVELVHLRYLSFTYEGTKDFPLAIARLQDLQTLIVYRGDAFRVIGNLPSTIWEMPHLRHLLLEKSSLPTKITGKDSVALENLQTLSGIINFRCSREVLEMMPNLKKLEISYFHGADYEFNNFFYLRQLETLKCHFSAVPVDALLVNLTFPPNLRKLTLSGCRIPWEKMELVGSLPNLEVLKLKDYAFKGPIWKPNNGEFSKLKFLLIENSNLKQWRANHTHFPNLRHLSLRYCFELLKIPSEIGYIPTLEMLELYGCRPSAMESAMQIQEKQWKLGNDSLRVTVNSSRDY